MSPSPSSSGHSHTVQPLAHRVLGVPAGDPKKTDVAVTREQLDTVDKFKGERGSYGAFFLAYPE